MITFEQAVEATEFHAGECTSVIGPKGGEKRGIELWRRNGQTLTWKRSPGRFQIPIKHGLYAYGHITNDNAKDFHVSEECPLVKDKEEASATG